MQQVEELRKTNEQLREANEGLMQKVITIDKKLEKKDKTIEKKDKLLGKKDKKLGVQERRIFKAESKEMKYQRILQSVFTPGQLKILCNKNKKKQHGVLKILHRPYLYEALVPKLIGSLETVK